MFLPKLQNASFLSIEPSTPAFISVSALFYFFSVFEQKFPLRVLKALQLVYSFFISLKRVWHHKEIAAGSFHCLLLLLLHLQNQNQLPQRTASQTDKYLKITNGRNMKFICVYGNELRTAERERTPIKPGPVPGCGNRHGPK